MFTKFIEKAKEIYKNEPTGHDFSHIERVLDFCHQIQKHEGGDVFVITISALFHDIHRVLSNKFGRFISAKEAMPFVTDTLSEFNIAQDNLTQILYLIENHDNKQLFSIPIELKVLQDADVLDSLGEVGLNRCLTYCKKHNIPVSNKQFPLDCEEYIPNINPISSTHYVFRTILPQASGLHTKTAKELAKQQTKVLENFVTEHTQTTF